jgi:hypothetical protein
MFVDIAMSGHAGTLTTQTNAGSGHPPFVIERDVALDEICSYSRPLEL